MLSLGPQPLKPGEVSWAEIAVLPPGDQVPNQSGRTTSSIVAVLAMATAVVVVVLGAWLHVSPSPSRALPEVIPQMPESWGPIVPGECGQAAWGSVLNACSNEMKQFYAPTTSNAAQQASWLWQTLHAGMTHLNLGDVGISWGSPRGLCRPHSRCPRALRGYLDYCPLDPAVVSAKVGWRNWSISERWHGQSNDDPCLDGSSPCDGYIDLLFLRQCLGFAFPGLLTPSTLTHSNDTHVPVGSVSGAVKTTSAVAPRDSQRARAQEQEVEKYPPEANALGSEPRTVNFSADTGTCEIATKVVFHECSAACSTQACGPVSIGGPSNCEVLRQRPKQYYEVKLDGSGAATKVNGSTLMTLNGCDCSCYGMGTTCESAIANALRVYAQAHPIESPGCVCYPQSYGGETISQDVECTRTLPASALATMLFAARGVRWIPIEPDKKS